MGIARLLDAWHLHWRWFEIAAVFEAVCRRDMVSARECARHVWHRSDSSTAREARGASAYMQQAATQAPLAPYPPPRLTHDGPLSQAQTSPARANFGRHGRQRAGAGARSKRPAGVSRLDVEYAASIDGGYASSIDQRTAGEAKGTHYIRNVFKPEQVMHQLIPHRFPQTREPSILH